MPAQADTADWSVLDVQPDITIRTTGSMAALCPALDAVVERHWRAACAGRTLFNGRVFCADRIAPDVIEGHWTEYRRTVAQMRDPSLRERLAIRNLAVCGALRCRDGVLVGRRDPAAVYQPGEWQLPPAGSVDDAAQLEGGASWRQALLLELVEELGLTPDMVTNLRPLCLVQHPSGVLDLGIAITTGLTGEALINAHRVCGNQEYDRLLVAAASDIPALVASQAGVLVPSAAAYLARLDSAPHRAS